MGILFNEFKGYFLPKGGLQQYSNKEELLTDGFDQLDWDFDGFFRGGNVEMYIEESDSHLNHEVDEPIDPSLMSRKQQRQLRIRNNKKKDKKVKKGRNKNDIIDYNQPSDPIKVNQLNKIYLQISKLIKNSNDEKIVQFFDVSIYKQDLINLKDDEWLNDNNLSFVYEYFERYLLDKRTKLISNAILLLRPSMSFLLGNFPNPIELKGVIPSLENNQVKFIFLPINDNDDVEAVESGSHWSLVVVSILEKTAYIYDTLERSNEKEALNLIKKVSAYLNNLKFNIQIMDTPQQINGSDCGIMACQLSGILLSRLLNLNNLNSNFMSFNVENVKISAIDGRIFVLGSILNVLKHKLEF